RLKDVPGPKLLHVITKKGKGLRQAEENQVTYHSPGKFNHITGDLFPKSLELQAPKYQDVFGITLVELAEKNAKIIGITPAMPTGSSLKFMMDKFPERAFDVGIAEQHAVTFAAGLVTQGMIVFCNIYSTFLQRAYDQVIHDVCLQKLPVIFCLDRAGIVGEDGATHHGIFDIAFLRCIPNLIVFAPRNEIELRNMLYTAQLGLKLPIAIRYPRGRGRILDWKKPFIKMKIGKGEEIQKGNKIAILSIGTILDNVLDAVSKLKEKEAIGIYDLRFIKPLDKKLLKKVFNQYETILTIEDGLISGGFGSAILEYAAANHYKNEVHLLGISDFFPEHGTVEELQDLSGISTSAILKKLYRFI
ncbi:MAG: 1-deoxy-D-xylulose-5-phosphate synthase, partial [Flavobacteriia bacterium]|nr:1-deoxy-D-xylulose-5-phosphate synthase [Flavobacteriia bacterium]